jgi:sialic acid synthase SpsE
VHSGFKFNPLSSDPAQPHKCGSLLEAPGRCLVIGEVAQAHDGSLGMAHAFIDAIASAGADAVKFQTHIAAAESTRAEPWRVKFSYQDETRYDYWKRMEFTERQWQELKQHADEQKLLFLSSHFSIALWCLPSDIWFEISEVRNPESPIYKSL